MTSQEVGEGGDNEQKVGSACLRTGVCLRPCVYVLQKKSREGGLEGEKKKFIGEKNIRAERKRNACKRCDISRKMSGYVD